MFGFNCCRAATAPDWILPDVASIEISTAYALRDDVFFNDWNNPVYGNVSPPRPHFGTYLYNNPLASLHPDGSPATPPLVVQLGMKRAVMTTSIEVPEFANVGNTYQPTAYPYNYVLQKFSGIAQGTTISQAQLVLSRDPHIPNPPVAITAIARVMNSANGSGYGAYPWSPTNSYGGAPSVPGVSFLPARTIAVTGSPIILDITSDVQTVINRPNWSSTNCFVTVLIFTVYPQAFPWINNIHPGGNFPDYPASNTALWFSDYDKTVGSFVRIAL